MPNSFMRIISAIALSIFTLFAQAQDDECQVFLDFMTEEIDNNKVHYHEIDVHEVKRYLRSYLSCNSYVDRNDAIINGRISSLIYVTSFVKNRAIAKAWSGSKEKYFIVSRDLTYWKELNYDFVHPFKNGYAEVGYFTNNQIIGAIDLEGVLVVPIIYKGSLDFNDNRAIFLSDGKYGILNTKGDVVVQPKYEKLFNFKSNYSCGTLGGKIYFIDTNGLVVREFNGDILKKKDVFDKNYYPFIGVKKIITNEKKGEFKWVRFALNFKGDVIINENEFKFIYAIGNDILLCKKEYSRANSDPTIYYFVNDKGNVVYTGSYENMTYEPPSFKSGMLRLRKKIVANKKSKVYFGYLDINLNEAVPFIYDKGQDFIGNFAVVSKDGKTGVIDKNNKVIVEFKEQDIYIYRNAFAQIRISLDAFKYKYGFVNLNSPYSYFILYDSMTTTTTLFDADGLLKVKIDGKEFAINKQGQCVKDCHNAPANHPKAK